MVLLSLQTEAAFSAFDQNSQILYAAAILAHYNPYRLYYSNLIENY